MHPNVHGSIINNSQDIEATWLPINKWMDKMWCTHTHTHTHTNGILLNCEKELKFAICNNMDGPSGYYAKWNKSEKDKYYVTSLICEF